MQADYFAVPLPEAPAGLGEPLAQEVGPVGQLLRVWRRGDQEYLSALLGGDEKWFVLVAMNGRSRPRCN